MFWLFLLNSAALEFYVTLDDFAAALRGVLDGLEVVKISCRSSCSWRRCPCCAELAAGTAGLYSKSCVRFLTVWISTY